MDQQQQSINNIAATDALKQYNDQARRDAEQSGKLKQLDKDTAHAEAAVYLSGELLKGVLPPADVRKFTTVGNGLIQMNKAFQVVRSGWH